ncbi:tRNA lysidine(34) synthetase TilS [Candidatus Vampirococcus lugosii]|uniref:tRNA(Ile)-lysidine synthase n=1 Tax=Candidatus Vampirococcus lugosii TaxID=2789015 RepID=A0ABS5QLY3_9BACT|nr:tRNA lysidine(34) synthetase TilS [Candidatus Vampirococcus lugosii]MBS8122148.1 tRNA(Ile)-lysidine synthetase [Candidatus Vampirococcus lugosii]
MNDVINFENVKSNIYKFLIENIEKHIKKIYIGVSGGSDSMFLFFVLQKIIYNFNFDIKIIVLHYNHGYREESFQESIFLQNYFEQNGIEFISGNYELDNFSENNLRKARYSFFDQNLNENSYLFLGHNLTDRVETSFVNMLRGAGIKGILNMKKISKKNNIYYICRPLLDIPKDKIKDFCDEFSIPYFQDYTNDNVDFSQRNFIRNNILKIFYEISNKDKNGNLLFLKSFINLYENIENIEKNSIIEYTKFPLPNIVDYDFFYLLETNIKNKEDLVLLFDEFNLYKNISSRLIDEFYNFFVNVSSGYKYLGGIYFLKSYNKIYIYKGKNKFWEQDYSNISQKINKIGKINFYGYNIHIDNKKIGYNIRFPNKNDIYGNKKFNLYLKKNKYPFFIRNLVAVIVDGNTIIEKFN